MLQIANKLQIDLDQAARIYARACVGLLYILAILTLLPLPASKIQLLLYLLSVTALPLWCSIKSSDDFPHLLTSTIAAAHFACLALTVNLFSQDVATWKSLASNSLKALVVIHLSFLILRRWTARKRVSPELFFTIQFISLVFLFRVEPANRWINMIVSPVSMLREPPLWWDIAIAIGLSLAFFAVLAWSWRKDHTKGPSRKTLPRTILLTSIFFLDLSLRSDVLHFLINIGPALQTWRGGVPMVDAFSQYGPGPLLLTYLSFVFGHPSFGAANLMAQASSLAFYGTFLFCLFRLSRYPRTAVTLGFLAIGVLLAGWWGGDGNLNTVPSSMGFRYLPNILIVASLISLPRDNFHSIWTWLALILASWWSFETMAGSACIYGAFVFFRSWRQPVSFLKRIGTGLVLPLGIGLASFSLLIFIWGQRLPDYPTYLKFLGVYNMLSDYWALSATGTFFGWLPVVLGVAGVIATAWGIGTVRQPQDETLLYGFVPMAALTIFMSAYFAGRSVDFTLIIAVLPFLAIVIPLGLELFGTRAQIRWLGLLIVAWCVFFSSLALFRAGSFYSLPLGECIQRGRCLPTQWVKTLSINYKLRPMVDYHPDSSGFIAEMMRLLEKYGAEGNPTALLAGTNVYTKQSVMTELGLLYANQGHRWPVSYVFTDELLPVRIEQILAAPVILGENEPVIVRKDETQLGPLETALLAKIRKTNRLCATPEAGEFFAVYRVARNTSCPEK